jgi:hypothetical protein
VWPSDPGFVDAAALVWGQEAGRVAMQGIGRDVG